MSLIETGAVSLSNTIAQGVVGNITFSDDFNSTPAVIAFVPTYNGGDSIGVRAKNVTTSGCDVFYEENTNLDNNHSGETVVWMAFETGHHSVDGIEWEAGIHTTSTTANSGDSTTVGDTVSFSTSFPSTPSILHTLNTYNNGEFKETGANSTTSSDFHLYQEEGSNTGAANATEDIAWVAMEAVGSGTINGVTIDVDYGSDGSKDGVADSDHNINFNASFGNTPDVCAKQQTRNGTEGAWARGNNSWGTGGVDVWAEESSYDEQSHADETFGYIAIEPNTVIAEKPTMDTLAPTNVRVI